MKNKIKKSYAQLIYNSESGDHFCLAATAEIADKIIAEEKSENPDGNWADLTYVELPSFS